MKRLTILYSILFLVAIACSTFLVNQYLNGIYQMQRVELPNSELAETTPQFACADGSCTILVSEKIDVEELK